MYCAPFHLLIVRIYLCVYRFENPVCLHQFQKPLQSEDLVLDAVSFCACQCFQVVCSNFRNVIFLQWQPTQFKTTVLTFRCVCRANELLLCHHVHWMSTGFPMQQQENCTQCQWCVTNLTAYVICRPSPTPSAVLQLLHKQTCCNQPPVICLPQK